MPAEWTTSYEKNGYFFPIQVLSENEGATYCSAYFEYIAQKDEELKTLAPREHYRVLSETHTILPWVHAIASHPVILDVVEQLIGPNILIWSSRWFSKMPGDKTYVSWHQDATYWGLSPLKVATAWVALSESIPENGCMRVIPETHKMALLPQIETYAPNNALTRGQEIAVEVDEKRAVDIALRPGQMSLHHVLIVHGSKANTSDKPRIGIAVRYIAPEVKQNGQRPVAMLVRGKDDCGNFDLIEPPLQGPAAGNESIQADAVKRMMKNILR
jgi:ectoine hydroxylase-related dioxygenase (phytanoyl-CoA dioxygenase family)